MNPAVLFDGDGVAFDTEHASLAALAEALAHFGAALRPGDPERLCGMTTPAILELFLAERGLAADLSAFTATRDRAYTQILEREGGPRPCPGARELLQWLAARNIPAALATSAAPPKMNRNLDGTGLRPYFRATVCGEEVPQGKPAPDIFLEAARRLRTPPHWCLVLEDSINGLRAAKAAGMIAIAVAGTLPAATLAPYADQVIESLEELIPPHSGSLVPDP